MILITEGRSLMFLWDRNRDGSGVSRHRQDKHRKLLRLFIERRKIILLIDDMIRKIY